MKALRVAHQVQNHYPDAVPAKVLMNFFLGFVKLMLGIDHDKIAFLSSICSDDLNSVESPQTGMIGPFILGGLDGYPFVGTTGVGAFAHHIPEKGAALLFYGPHVGITDAGEIGMVIRPGQTTPSACCGAAMAGLTKLRKGKIKPKKPSHFKIDDYQQETLEQILRKNKKEILGPDTKDKAGQVYRTTEVVYRATKKAFDKLLSGVDSEAPAFIFGGIVINQDDGGELSIALRSVTGAQGKKRQDFTGEFKKQAEKQFREVRG
jgi:hypothetical protein